MIGAEEQLLAEAIRDTFREGSKAESRLGNIELNNTIESVERGPHSEELAEASEMLSFYVSAAFRHVAVLAERLGLRHYAEQIMRARLK